MHEASLTQGLLKTVIESVEAYNNEHPCKPVSRVRLVRCSLGLIACVEERSLLACFELFSEGTVAQGARLELARSPLDCSCRSCGCKFALLTRNFVCPRCGGSQIQFSGGHGLVLEALTVDSEEAEDD